VEEAAATCAATGAHLLVNTAPARPLGPAMRRAGAVVVANAAEARAMVGVADPGTAADALRSATGSPAVVTLG
ncbi:MAG TPA: hypothetical protein VE152_01900, partial [Acidimicrobiales bacterium]|nr:hypothetical protein [Acidimicrobiales bacterium]